MLQGKEFVDPKLLAKVFEQICEGGHTGVFQAITEKAEVLYFDIKGGNVVNIRYRTKKNKEALQEFGVIGKSKYAFYERKEVKEPHDKTGIPTNKEVLQYLLGQSTNPPSTSKKNNTDDNRQLVDSKGTLTDSAIVDLKKTLTNYIGPVANIVCKEVFAKTTNVNTAINMLAKEIPTADHARAFREKTKHLLVVESE